MQMKSIFTTGLILAGISLSAGQAVGDEVSMITLKSLDGTVVITGELRGFEAGYYNIVVASIGLVSVAEDLVTCQSTSIDCAALVGSS